MLAGTGTGRIERWATVISAHMKWPAIGHVHSFLGAVQGVTIS